MCRECALRLFCFRIFGTILEGLPSRSDCFLAVLFSRNFYLQLDCVVKIDFARDINGLYFARIEGGKYYPINIEPSEELLKKGRYFKKLADSSWRRILEEPNEIMRFGPILYTLDQIAFSIEKIKFSLEEFNFGLKNILFSLQSLEENTDVLNRNI